MLNPLPRRAAIACALAVLVTSVTPSTLDALQSPTSSAVARAQGVRQHQARYVADQFFNVWAAATDDGLVEVWSEPGRQSFTVRPTDPKTIREFFTPEDITAWADTVEAMMRSPRPSSGPGVWRMAQTPRPYGRRLQARFAANELTDRTMIVALEDCPRAGTMRAQLKPSALDVWLSVLRTVAEEARKQQATNGPRAAPAPTSTYWYHAMGCPAEPLPTNEMPATPAGEGRPYELLAEFVVDTGGIVVSGSLRVPADADARYVAALEQVLPRWRFTQPSRAGHTVRQVVHVPVRFDPVTTRSTSGPTCIDAPARGLLPRLSAPNARTALLPSGYITSVARRLTLFPSLPRPGTTIRFVLQRFGGVSDVRVRAGKTDSPPDAEFGRWMAMLHNGLEPLPVEYPDDALGLEIDVHAECPPDASVALRTSELRAAVQPDGLVQISYVSLTDASMGAREMPVWRDVIDPGELTTWADSVQARVPKVDSAARPQSGFFPRFVPGAPILGFAGTRGLRIGLTVAGDLHGGVYCRGYEMGLVITPQELPRVASLVRRVARDATPAVGEPNDRVYWEHEVACPVTEVAGNPRPTFPTGLAPTERSGHEVLVTLVVDTSGVPDSSSVRALPGNDPRFAAAAEQAVRRWRFYPASRGGKRVRQAAHVPVLLRPDDADATLAAVASGTPLPTSHPPFGRARETPPPTVFSRPPENARTTSRSRRPATSEEPAALRVNPMERLEPAMQPYVKQARETFAAAKARFLAGLPDGYDFFVTARLRDATGRWEQVFVAVDRIQDGRIRGRIASPVRFVKGFRMLQPYELPEADLIDWTIVDPFGREEGNVVGKFLDTHRDGQPPSR